MRNFKKKWFDELDSHIPPLDSAVMSAPIPEGEKKSPPIFMRLRTPVIAALCLLIISVSVIFLIPKAPPPDTEPFVTSALMLEINPKAVFIANEDGVVVEVVSMNSDADVILSSQTRRDSLIGVSVAEATVSFLNYAARAGYIDLDVPDAIRLSGSGDVTDDIMSGAVDALRGYFSENNIMAVVAPDKLSVSDFSQRLGVSGIETKEALKAHLSEQTKLFCERQMQGKSEQEIKDSYESTFVEGYLKSEITEKIDAYVLDTSSLVTLNLRIVAEAHVDYFTALEYGSLPFFELSDEAQTLISQMSEELTSYEEKYGVQIDSSDALAEAAFGIADLLTDFLTAWAESIDGAINSLPHAVGLDEGLRSLVGTLPTTAEEYAQSVASVSQRLFESTTRDFSESFEAERGAVDYSKLESDIIAEYGSLSAYFDYLSGN